MPMLKVCGITRLEDAAAACGLGYDAVGMVFAESPRRVSPDRARDISRALPTQILRVGVFVDEDIEEVKRVAEYCGLDLVQFHGDESPGEVSRFGSRAVKALRPRVPGDLAMMEEYPDVFAILLDTWDPVLRGGTGTPCDWGLAARASRERRVILAGGLSPANVREALEMTGPFGVDVSSGVELSPGIKDAVLMRDFASAARSAVSITEREEDDDAGIRPA